MPENNKISPENKKIGPENKKIGPEKKKISIVVPVYNEEETLQALYDRLLGLMDSLSDKYEFEMVFTDNHSEDATFSILNEFSEKDPRVKVISFSRNFGYQPSINTGYAFATGDAAVQLDADMQDPPEMIEEFLQKWEQGYKVVYGIRKDRDEGWLIKTIRKLFYRVIDFLSIDKLPHDAGDFRLIDRCVIDELKKLYDASPYLRGTIATMGFKQTGIPYKRDPRTAGISKFSFTDMFRLAMDGIISHSIIPLRIATFLGFAITGGAVLMTGVYVYGRYFAPEPWPRGFATTTVLLLFGIGVNSLFLGVLGEYVGRIYTQVKRRPIVIVEKTRNI